MQIIIIIPYVQRRSNTRH